MKEATQVVIVLDKSGSMESVRKDTIGGFNTFIKEQQALEGECKVTLIQFSDRSKTTFSNKDVKDVKPLTDKTYVPGGSTALLDAVGTAIDKLGEDLAAMDESERPNKIIMLIMTDGEENSSKEYSWNQVKDKITHQREKYNWVFNFIGANIDAVKTGGNLGISGSFSVNYCASAAGTSATFGTISKKLCSLRSIKGVVDNDEAEATLCYTASDRSVMMSK